MMKLLYLFLLSVFSILFTVNFPLEVGADKSSFTDFDIPVCRISSRLRGPDNGLMEEKRIIAIGDVHGSFEGLTEILRQTGLTSSAFACQWRPEVENTILVQVGDIVDRGNGTLSVWRCLQSLQQSARNAHGSEVVRLIGNHDIWWLENQIHNRNFNTDTPEVISEVASGMKEGILNGNIVGSHVLRVQGMPVFFTHAGWRPEMLSRVEEKLPSGHSDPEDVSSYVNRRVRETVETCRESTCSFTDELFQAGAERGGRDLGGPFWTDYSILAKAAETSVPRVIQVVGHSIGLNRIRTTKLMQAIGIDSGMYLGGRSFLEINANGRFLAHEKTKDTKVWNARDLTKELCDH